MADDELWRVREQGRANLVAFVRRHLRASLTARGVSESDLAWTDEALDPRALTVCFARRFATYKRATLLLSQPDRLRALLLSTDRPVQFVFAGKAHPADDAGKEMIRQIVSFSSDPVHPPPVGLRRRLRHRRRPLPLLRAPTCGSTTPGGPWRRAARAAMKAALNGALNCSILDGWWDECFDGENGWAITSAESLEPPKRDQVEADSLFSLLEQPIVPLFYERIGGPVPRRWVGRVKASLASLGPQVSATRMVGDYVAELYEPTAARADELARRRLRAGQGPGDLEGAGGRAPGTASGSTASRPTRPPPTSAGERSVTALVALGDPDRADVEVQLLHGPVGQNDELVEPAIVAMVPEGDGRDGAASLRRLVPSRTGRALRLHRAGRPPLGRPGHARRARPGGLGGLTVGPSAP